MGSEQHVDAIVVGGGPAGSTAAAVLARAGRSVAVLERARFPREHIGESLLPHVWYTLDRIGAVDLVAKAGFQRKHSVRFVSADGRMSRPFLFQEHKDHPSSQTWQVERATFDRLLLEHAEASGAVVHQGTRAKALIEEDGRVVGVRAEGPDGPLELRAPWTIDASGRDGFVRTLRGWRNREEALERLSYWTYYRGIEVDPQTAHATTVVQVPEDGWFWFFPMGDGRLSVGVVARREVLHRHGKDPATVWEEVIKLNPWLAERLQGGERVAPIEVTSDYSYRSTYSADDGVVLTGDAFAFLDPVFSSGVFLAVRTGEEAARGVLSALDDGRTDAGVFAAYGEWVCRGIEAMRSLVFSFYDPDFSMGALVRAHPELHGDVTDLLIGDLFRDYADLQQALAELGTVPPVLGYGGARVQSVEARPPTAGAA
ncbi:MAG: tryptophan 7-halogenase [Alphaproteobacteria bacterium]|nr:tryptophan 7-halogenase [Alphaproteobacteria bacterium]